MEYKVRDKVRINSLDWYNENKDKNGFVDFSTSVFVPGMSQFCGKIVTIEDVFEEGDNVVYCMEGIDYDWTNEMFEGLVEEEEIEFTEEDKYWCDIMNESDPTTYVLPQGYQFVDENGNVINTQKIVLEKKKKEYPKTFRECQGYLGEDVLPMEEPVSKTHRRRQIHLLEVLLTCRDAYWKIAGEEMGLSKPWSPNWQDDTTKYTLVCINNGIEKDWELHISHIFSFPTAKMRDAFYENFKELIESVKELL